MYLRLPLFLRRAVLSSMVSCVSASFASGAISDGETIVFCGDSITQGAGSGIGPGYRYQVFKNFVDNGMAYNPLGSHSTAGGATPNYGDKTFNQANEGHSGWWASDLNGTRPGMNHAAIENWTGQSTTLPGGGAYTGATYKPDAVFILAGTNDLGHMTNATAPSTEEMVNRILKCADQYKAANAAADIYISAILPMEASSTNWPSLADYNKRTRAVNEALKKLAAEKGFTFVETDKGIRGEKDVSILLGNALTGDGLHPNAQGELIMAGNIARSLGIGQRNAGLTRTASSSLTGKLGMSTIPASGMNGRAWTKGAEQNTFLICSSGSSYYEQSWTGASLTQGYTCELSLQMFSTAGDNRLSLKLGNGTTTGLLNVETDRVSWGSTILYVGLNTDTVSDFRVVYNPGDAAKGITAGYYVWRNGMLIGEALAGTNGSLNGLQAGALDGNRVLAGITGLTWDTSGAYAPNYTGVIGSDAKGTERLDGFDALGKPGAKLDWKMSWTGGTPTEITKTTPGDVKAAIDALTGTPKNAKITSTFTGGNSSPLIAAFTGDAYLDLSGTWVNTDSSATRYLNLVNGGTYKGNLYYRISEGGRITTGTAAAPGAVYQGALIGSNNSKFSGNLYMEFDSSALTIEGRMLLSADISSAIVGVWSNTAIEGSVTMVFGKGTFGFAGNTGNQGAIMAGGFNSNDAAGTVSQNTSIQIDGGTFYGAISSGGYRGHVATIANKSANILIRGGTISGNIYGGSLSDGSVGTSSVASGTNIVIDGTNISASHALSISGNIYGGSRQTGTVFGDSNITLSNFDQSKLAAFAATMTFNGGAQGAGSVMGKKILTFDNVQGSLVNGVNNFDRIVVTEGSDVSLSHANSATALKNIDVSGDGLLSLKVGGNYQYSLSHVGGKGSLDAATAGVISNIVLGKVGEGNVVTMNSLKLATSFLSFDIGKGGDTEAYDSLVLASMTSMGKVDIAINAWQNQLQAGEYDLIVGNLTGVNSFVLSTLPQSARQEWNLVREDGKLSLLVTGESTKNLEWNGGAQGIWQRGSSTPWNDGAGASTFENGDIVSFGTLAGISNSVVTLEGTLVANSMTVSGDTNYTWTGKGGISGSGNLTKTGNGTLLIETNNSGYLGKITLGGGVMEMGSATAFGSGSLIFNGGVLKYATDVLTDVSSQIATATTGNDNTIRVDTNGNNVKWASSRSDYTYVKSGLGELTLRFSGASTLANALTVQAGAIGLDSSSGNITFSGLLSGLGDLNKTGTNALYITSATNDLKGTLHVKGGGVTLGSASTTGANANLGADCKIIVEKDASFTVNIGGGNNPINVLFSNAYVKSGGAFNIIDSNADLKGGMHFNVKSIGSDGVVAYDREGTMSMSQYWAKRVVFSGIVAGSGSVNFSATYDDLGKDHQFVLSNNGNTFDGIYNIGGGFKTTLEVAAENAAAKSSISLKTATSNLLLSGAAEANISVVNLDSVTGSTITASGGAKTLIINDNKDNVIAGTLGDAANVLNIEKKGTDTLAITGIVQTTGTIKASKGTLQLGAAATYTIGAGVSIEKDAALNVGGSNFISVLTMSKLTLASGSRLMMDVGPGASADKLVYTGTNALSGAIVLDVLVSGTTQVGEYLLIDSTTTAFDASFSVGAYSPVVRGMQGNFIQTSNQLKLNITNVGGAGNLVWNGTTSSNIWELKGATNWTGEADNKFFNTDNVSFTDASVNKAVVIKGSVAPSSIVVNSSGDYVFTGDSSQSGILGQGALTKSGSGKLTINTNNSNWSGTIALTGGILEFGKNAQGKGVLTMENGTQLVWGTDNNKVLGGIVANGASVQLNTGANNIGSQTITGTYNTLRKTGLGSITLALSGAGKTLNVEQGIVTLGSADITTSFIIGQGATLKLTTNTETREDTGKLTLNGGTLDFGTVGNSYIGGSLTSMTAKSQIIGAASSFWRLEGGRVTTVSVAEQGSGSSISVGAINFTRNTNAITFNIADGIEKFDLRISSNLQTTSGGEKLKKTGTGTLLFTGTSTSDALGLVLEGGVVQIGNASNGDSNGVWAGSIDVWTAGRLVIDKTDALDLCTGTNLLSGTGTIDIINTGKVNLANVLHTYNGTINLMQGATLNISGGAMATGTKIVIDKGNLENASGFVGSVSVNQSTTASSVNLGGLRGEQLKSVSGIASSDGTDTVTKISGVTGNISLAGNSSFGVSSDMLGLSSTGSGQAPIVPTGEAITTTDKGVVNINGVFSLSLTDAAVQLLIGEKGDKDVTVRLTNGNLSIVDGGVNFKTPYNILSNIFTYGGTVDGSVLLSMKDPQKQGWLVLGNTETTSVNDQSKGLLSGVVGIHNNGSIAINVTGTETLALKNLEGSKDGALINSGTNANLTLSLINTADIPLENGVSSSLYHGSITGAAAIEKNGMAGTTYNMTILGNVETSKLTVNNGALTIGGVLKTAQASTVNAGATLLLNGIGNQLNGGLVLSNTGSFKLGAGATAITTAITSADTSVIDLASGSILSLSASGDLNSVITGTGGTLALHGNGTTLTIGASGNIGKGTVLSLNSQTQADFAGDSDAAGIKGEGVIKLNGGNLFLHDSTQIFNGTLEGSGIIDHVGNGTQTLKTAGNADIGLVQSGEGSLILNYQGTSIWDSLKAMKGTVQVTNSVSVNELHLAAGSHTILGENLDSGVYLKGAIITSSSTELEGGSRVTLGGVSTSSVNQVYLAAGDVTHSGNEKTEFTLGTVGNWTDSEYSISIMSGQGIDRGDYASILKGAAENLGYTVENFIYEDSVLKLVIKSSGSNGFLRFANSANTRAAANGLWDARLNLIDESGTLSSIISSIRDANSGAEGKLSSQEATMALASYAGSSLTSLASTQRQGLLQQVKWIRNRTTQMGVNPGLVNEDMPYVNAWVQGNGGYHKLSQEGDKAGYTMNSWGGTAGVDVDLNDRWVVGAAFTADYGKITTESYDPARGHNDAYYGNLFARYQKKNWAHTMIVTGGWNDADLSRNVAIGSEHYSTRGSTSGTSFGAYYEGTYDIAINSEKTSIFQPLVNASIYHSTLDSYSEMGMGDASMAVDSMKATYGTIGLGARLAGIVGTNILGRGALGEVRAQVVQDYGDKTDKVVISPLGSPSSRMNILGAKAGTTGFQIGAGITVPIGERSSIYADADADFRSRATIVTGNIGYRYNF